METNELIVEKSYPIPVPDNKKRNVGTVVITSSLYLLSALSISAIIFLWNQNNQLVASNDQLSTKIDSMNVSLTNKIEGITKETKDVADKSLRLSLYGIMEHGMEVGIVTDDLYVSKITFWGTITTPSTTGTTIDIEMQPKNLLKHKGAGKLDFSDREIKSMMDDLFKKLEASYTDFKTKYLQDTPDWKKLQHRVTIQNYEIGTFTNGAFKLKGE
jgi:hypothetical protein